MTKDFVHRTTITQSKLEIIIAALEQYNSIEAREILAKFRTMSFKATEGLAKPAYELKGRSNNVPNITNLGFEEVASKEGFDFDAFMREQEAASAKNGNPTVERRAEEIVPDEYKRHDDPKDTDADNAASFFDSL